MSMTNEERFVVNPLIRWLKHQNAAWQIYIPSFGSSATGWDIEARRKNLDLLIEAKYINRAFLSAFAGLVTASLANRRQHFKTKKYRSWSFGVCWAIGTPRVQENVLQILFDYIARNPMFWKHYAEDVRMRYIFFVRGGRVARVPFVTFLRLAERYALEAANGPLSHRREIAGNLMRKFRAS